MQRLGSMVGAPILLLLLFLPFLASFAVRAEPASIDPALNAHLRNAVFEVVMRKPEKDPATYERELPLELMTYRERTDPYISIGTAFAIAKNTYVSAAHVLDAGRVSQYGEPALRDSAGQVHPLDQVLKYSDEKDFIVFSLKEPAGTEVLEPNREVALNAPVYAAGNALGEGIVIRDGLLTSTTPEELDGRWKWLRFSAAASPGNSGGPLLDAAGRVIGVVLRKSQNENLNYAVPIELVLDAPINVAEFSGYQRYILPVMMDVAETERAKHTIALPLSFARFQSDVNAWSNALYDRLQKQLIAKHADEMFPKGAGSEELLNSGWSGTSLQLIQRSQDGSWHSQSAGRSYNTSLPHNGSVSVGASAVTMVIRIERPDDVEANAFYSDSKLYMDYLLKAVPIKRFVGPEQIRVVSLGKALSEDMFTDAYGRKWQVRTWKMPFLNTVIVSYALAVPDGFVGMARATQSIAEHDTHIDLRAMTAYVDVALSGKLSQWREYLAQAALLPKNFKDISLTIDFKKGLQYRSPRMSLAYTEDMMHVNARADLTLNFTYIRDRGDIVWDVVGLFVNEGEEGERSFAITRYMRPPESLPDTFQTDWRKRVAGSYPYDGHVDREDGTVSVEGIYPLTRVQGAAASGAPEVLYQLSYSEAGSDADDKVKATLARWIDGVTVHER